MKDVPLLDELRAARRRLAEAVELDVQRYAAMLRGVGEHLAGEYVKEPIVPPATFERGSGFKEAG